VKDPNRPSLLLHCCCAPCGTHPLRILAETYAITVVFDNPNIFPASEYESRLEEIRALCGRWGFPLKVGRLDTESWRSAVRGFEQDPEGGGRCDRCIQFRLERTAELARDLGMDAFTTTLSISPHKKADRINRIGREIAGRAGARFLEADFKKKDGFRASCEISRSEGLYRQDYCGCEFSLLEARERRKAP
jgi:predicted adenine nucleotide alpha hydrolase (AANH) superfamily ATPase